MFGFLKKKIQEAINSFKKADLPEEKTGIDKEKVDNIITDEKLEEKKDNELKKVQQEKKEIKKEEKKTEKQEKKQKQESKEIKKDIKTEKTKEENFIKKESKQEKEIEEIHIETEKQETEKQVEKQVNEQKEKKGFFGKISEIFTTTSISEQKFEELFYDLEIGLLENNVAYEVIEKIKQDLKQELVNKKIPKVNLEQKITDALKASIKTLFDIDKINLIEKIKSKKDKPYIILMIGINGTGKTTTIAKLVNLFKKNNLTSVIGACDTFRAAAIQQLEEHANNLNVKLIKHDYGSDPAAVAFDTIKHAKAKNIDVVLIDTAGRLHSNANLMAELEKIIRVIKPDFKIFVGESIAGNDVVEQIKLFNEKSGIDGIILSKADIDEKGGAAISVSYITGKPILYLGTGQNYEDLIEFNENKIIEQIFD